MPAKKKKTKRKTTARKAKTIRKTTTKKKTKTTRKTAKKRATASTSRSKTAKRKTAKRKTSARAKTRSTSKSLSLGSTAIKTAYTKSQLLTAISEATELSKKDVSNVLEALGNEMHRHLRKGGARQFTVPGLMKCVVKQRPARPARKGINPFTGEATTFKAKPATSIVKIRPLKSLKEMVK